MSITPWNGTVAGLVALETSVQQAEQLVARCRSRFLATTYPATEAQVVDALTSGGIRSDKIDEYVTAWKRQLLTVARPLTLAQQRAQGLIPPATTRRRTPVPGSTSILPLPPPLAPEIPAAPPPNPGPGSVSAQPIEYPPPFGG